MEHLEEITLVMARISTQQKRNIYTHIYFILMNQEQKFIRTNKDSIKVLMYKHFKVVKIILLISLDKEQNTYDIPCELQKKIQHFIHIIIPTM